MTGEGSSSEGLGESRERRAALHVHAGRALPREGAFLLQMKRFSPLKAAPGDRHPCPGNSIKADTEKETSEFAVCSSSGLRRDSTPPCPGPLGGFFAGGRDWGVVVTLSPRCG